MDASYNEKPVFTLSVTAELLNVHPRTLMIYENQSLVIPLRTKTNRRRYSQNDIKRLQFIRYLTTSKGINLAGVDSILALLKFGEKNGIDLQRACFPDFTETVTL
jgi:MerR family transcriptional regulator/heat shock protein HspR